MNFEFTTATRIIFGAGKLSETASIVGALGGGRVLVVVGKSPGRAAKLLASLAAAQIETTIVTTAGEPTIATIQEGIEIARTAACDVVIGFGGGSVLDAGKAIAALLTNAGDPLDYLEVVGKGKPILHPSAPYIAIPTTAGTGAEVTRNAVLGVPEHHVKVSMRSPLMLPAVALVDPELTYGLPPAITASTGLDALTQLIEPFVSCKRNPMTDAICRDGMQRVARSLTRAVRDDEPSARADMALASLFGGLALANAGLGAVHGFAGPLGGMFDAPHGALCAALLPHVLEINQTAARTCVDAATVQRFEEIRQLVGDVSVLVASLNIPTLRQYGIARDAFPVIIEKAAQASSMKGNPVTLSPAALMEVLERAW